ncbi:MAG: VWA domain-containing protein [Chromatiaceae bacterium]|nr:MAG: VWA domain-containing protein [Chromatiaceae bacterium]
MNRFARGCYRWLLGLGLLVGLVGGASAANQVAVVLDTSLSMQVRLRDGTGPNDPGRLAVLATMLLYDLVDPNPRRPGSPDHFVVFPFQSDWPAPRDLGDALPTGTGVPIVATDQSAAAREAFWAALHALPYDGRYTYFYPGLRAAFAALLGRPAAADDRRVLVLVTDGVPEPEAMDREAAALTDLRRELLAAGVQLYVLAFGPTAHRDRAFFDTLYADSDGAALGALFIDPSGHDLVLNMTRLFAGAFGYLVEHVGGGARQRTLDLAGDVTPPKVALLALRRDGAPPAQTLVPAVNSARGLLTARELGAAYSVQAIEGLRPDHHYTFTTDGDDVEVAILRQIATELSLLPGHFEGPDGAIPMDAGRPLRRVVAETPFVLRVQARSPTGTPGNQPDFNIAVKLHGPLAAGCSYDWSDDFGAPIAGSRRRFGPGVTYDVRLRFRENDKDQTQPYRGHVEVSARHRAGPGLPEQAVAALRCATAHALEVWPRLAFRTLPPDATLDPASLARQQRGCARFRLELDDPARLGVLDTDTPRLRAWLDPSAAALAAGPFAGAAFSLDGKPLGWPGADTPWHAGQALTPPQLLGEHEFCVTLGTPQIVEPSADLDLPLQLMLDHSPYDDFRVIEPFVAKLRVLPVRPPSLDHFPWDALWALLLALLALLAALRWWLPRYPLPRAFAVSLWAPPATADGPAAPLWQPLPEPAWWQRLVGLNPPRPLRDGADHLVGWIKPLDQELYTLRPAPGLVVSQSTADGKLTRVAPNRGGRTALSVWSDYRLAGDHGRCWWLRVGYAAPALVHRHWRTRRPGDDGERLPLPLETSAAGLLTGLHAS